MSVGLSYCLYPCKEIPKDDVLKLYFIGSEWPIDLYLLFHRSQPFGCFLPLYL